MFWRLKKHQESKSVAFDIEDGDFVELTLRGYYANGSIHTMSNSYFDLPAGKLQTDPDVFVKRIEED